MVNAPARESLTPADGGRRCCLVVHPRLRGRETDLRLPEARLEEAVGLAGAIGLAVARAEIIAVQQPRPSTLLGQGTVERLRTVIAGDGAANGGDGQRIDVAVIDGPLSPVQQRNLERAWSCKVIDRTGLILEIFAERARTREGRLQVELARLSYQRSRLVRTWTHLERQRGGFGFLAGPGETQIESDRRQIGDRITRLKRELAQVARTRALHRLSRKRVPYPVVALVGYTNAGKSTLFNRLTGAGVDARNMLFATLDPTMRGLGLPSGRPAILSDTVGFISDLPHELVAAFRATLEEVCEANLIIHVRDASHPDSEAQRNDVHAVLRDLGLGEAVEEGMIEALNKIDRLEADDRRQLANRAARGNAPAIPVSALTGEGCDDLLAAIDARLARGKDVIDLTLPAEDGATLAWLYARGEVLARRDDDGQIRLRVRLDPADAERLADRRAAPTVKTT